MPRAKLTRALLLSIILALCLRLSATGRFASADENPGVIQGVVAYENGNPAGGATVYAFPMDRALGAIIPRAMADENGNFVIRNLWLGKYALGGEKLSEDYLDMTNPFYGDDKFETVILTSDRPAATVNTRLGSKAGILTGTVSDAVTGAPLNPCVEFRRSKRPEIFLSGTGLINAKYRALVPADTDVLIKVWYGGHKPWYYPGTTNIAQSRPINLGPSQEIKLEIRLQPNRPDLPGECGVPASASVRQ